MSFRGDDQRRYGHVPPVQYPVAGHPLPSSEQSPPYPPRRLSFNNGDDSASSFDRPGSGSRPISRPVSRPNYQPALNTTTRGYGPSEDELFLGGSPHIANTEAGRPSIYTNSSAMSGYQHQYQATTPPTPSTYNPQAFARSQSTNLPYHPHPGNNINSSSSSRWAQPNNAQPTTSYSPTTPSNFTPAPYNPAASSPAASVP